MPETTCSVPFDGDIWHRSPWAPPIQTHGQPVAEALGDSGSEADALSEAAIEWDGLVESLAEGLVAAVAECDGLGQLAAGLVTALEGAIEVVVEGTATDGALTPAQPRTNAIAATT